MFALLKLSLINTHKLQLKCSFGNKPHVENYDMATKYYKHKLLMSNDTLDFL